MWTETYYVDGHGYEATIDETVECCEDCENCPYVQIVGGDDFIEICGKDGTLL